MNLQFDFFYTFMQFKIDSIPWNDLKAVNSLV